MLRPGKVQVVKSTELDEGTGQTEGMIRKSAIVGMSDRLCASGRSIFPVNYKISSHSLLECRMQQTTQTVGSSLVLYMKKK